MRRGVRNYEVVPPYRTNYADPPDMVGEGGGLEANHFGSKDDLVAGRARRRLDSNAEAQRREHARRLALARARTYAALAAQQLALHLAETPAQGQDQARREALARHEQREWGWMQERLETSDFSQRAQEGVFGVGGAIGGENGLGESLGAGWPSPVVQRNSARMRSDGRSGDWEWAARYVNESMESSAVAVSQQERRTAVTTSRRTAKAKAKSDKPKRRRRRRREFDPEWYWGHKQVVSHHVSSSSDETRGSSIFGDARRRRQELLMIRNRTTDEAASAAVRPTPLPDVSPGYSVYTYPRSSLGAGSSRGSPVLVSKTVSENERRVHAANHGSAEARTDINVTSRQYTETRTTTVRPARSFVQEVDAPRSLSFHTLR